MPELPEVETVCLALSKILSNSRVSDIEIFRKDLRWNIKENLEKDLKEKILKKPYRRGKYILIPTSKEYILLVHFGSFSFFFHSFLEKEYREIIF